MPDPLPAGLESQLVAAFEAPPAGREAALAAVKARFPGHEAAVDRLVAEVLRRSEQHGGSLLEAFAEVVDEPTERIGPFRLLECLGRGGMGVVWLAEQTEPVPRKVALKLLGPRHAQPELLARFEVERQALALLDHPHIAKVLDAGTTPQGRPWLALEYVASRQSVTAWCDQQRLPVPARLRLFVRICDAVQHAHSRGILHRDLKPGNVLVDTRGAEAVPKVIDFGVAKAVGGDAAASVSAAAAFATVPGTLLGTSVYMSPEQARGQLDIDVRTDVHALGALLHELLTGEYPGEEHDLAGLFRRDLPRFLHHVTTVPVTPPRRRVLALGDGAARRCGTTARRLAPQIGADLDAIVLRAMAKDRERRYASAADLQRDVERWLAGAPVEARGRGLGYRTAKFVRRHALAAGVVVAAVAAVAVGVFVVVRTNASLSAANELLAATNTRLAAANRELELRAAELLREREEKTAALTQSRQSEQRAVELQQEAEAASGEARLAATTARIAERRASELLAAVLADASVIEEARLVLADLLSSRTGAHGAEGIAVADWLGDLTRGLDSERPLWSDDVCRELRLWLAWWWWGLGDDDAARAQFARVAAADAPTGAARLERAQALHALGDAVRPGTPADLPQSIAHLRGAQAILLEEVKDPRDPRLLRVQGDLMFLLFQSPQPADRREAQMLLAQVLGQTLGMSLTQALFGVQRLLVDVREQVAASGFAAALPRIDEFLAPMLQSSLRLRLANILLAASTYPELRADRELVLRAALCYGERLNGRAHRHTREARTALVARLCSDAAVVHDPSRRAEVFVLTAEQLEVESVLRGAGALPAALATFADTIATALGEGARAEFARILAGLGDAVGADNPVRTFLRQRSGA